MTYNKQSVIDLARVTGSTATTFAGAYRFLRSHPRYVRPIPGVGMWSQMRNRRVDPLPRKLDLDSSPATRTITPHEAWRLTDSRRRWELRQDRLAREIMAEGRYLTDRRRKPVALLSRDEYELVAYNTCYAMGLMSIPDAETLAASLTTPFLHAAATALAAAWPYRRSTSSWAGGEHTVSVRIADSGFCGASCETEKVWSDNGKWSGSNSRASIATNLATLMEFPTLMTRDGLVLCHAEKLAPREYRVTWIEQSTGVALKTIDGYLIRGYHVRASGIEQARKKAYAARSQGLAATLRARVDAQVKRAKLASYKSVYIAVEDSTRAGNCTPMTETFARQMWDKLGASGPCAVRADVVLATRDDVYTRRALGAALAHA